MTRALAATKLILGISQGWVPLSTHCQRTVNCVGTTTSFLPSSEDTWMKLKEHTQGIVLEKRSYGNP